MIQLKCGIAIKKFRRFTDLPLINVPFLELDLDSFWDPGSLVDSPRIPGARRPLVLVACNPESCGA